MPTGIYGEPCVADHTVYITDRGGTHRVAQLVSLSQVQWTRVRDAVSDAQVIVRGIACTEQADILGAIEPKRSEIAIYRGDQRVWEGPVSLVGWHSDWVEIRARDVGDYVFGRPLSKLWNNAYPNVTTVSARLAEMIDYELTHPFTYVSDKGDPVVLPAWEKLDPPANVLPFLQVHSSINEVRTSARTTPFQMTVGEHLDNYARTGGIDYTVLGRALHIWDTSRPLGQLRTFTEADFHGEIVVSAYGSDHASVAFAVASDGRYGGAGGIPTSWRIMEKSGPAGTQVNLPPKGKAPRKPSILDAGPKAWHGYRYWMAYQPNSASNTIRIAASKSGGTTGWVTPSGRSVDADPGAGVTLTPGQDPDISWSDDDRLWLFWIEGQNFYRSRSDDGKDFTSKILLYTAPGGTTLASPSLTWNPTTRRWTMFAINTAPTPNTVVWMTSTTSNLDAAGQWGPLNTAVLRNADGSAFTGDPTAITVRRVGSEWIGMLTLSSGVWLMNATVGKVAANGFTLDDAVAFPATGSGYTSVGRATFTVQSNGGLRTFFGGLGSAWRVYRTVLTGPDPVIGTGDKYLEYYGPWTKMFTVYDEQETAPPTQTELNSQAKRNLAGRSPVPIEVRVPDNSTIHLSAGITLDSLVPGVHIPLLATLNTRTVSQMQKLDKVTVTETSDGETVQVTLVPATRPDSDTPEEED